MHNFLGRPLFQWSVGKPETRIIFFSALTFFNILPTSSSRYPLQVQDTRKLLLFYAGSLFELFYRSRLEWGMGLFWVWLTLETFKKTKQCIMRNDILIILYTMSPSVVLIGIRWGNSGMLVTDRLYSSTSGSHIEFYINATSLNSGQVEPISQTYRNGSCLILLSPLQMETVTKNIPSTPLNGLRLQANVA